MSFQSYYWLLVPVQGCQSSVLNRLPQFVEAAEPLRQSSLFVAVASLATGVLRAWNREQEIIRKKGLKRAALLNRGVS